MRAVCALFLLVGSLVTAHAQALQRVDIEEIGIYTASTDKIQETPGTASGRSQEVSNVQLVKSTTTVLARLGAKFGFRFQLVGHNGEFVNLQRVTRVPSPGIYNPETGGVTLTSVSSLERKVGGTYYAGYGLDDEWEIVPGTWTLELWDGDRKLASQSFNVVKE
jgi:hypothetical protein